jgi:hypothetical protein
VSRCVTRGWFGLIVKRTDLAQSAFVEISFLLLARVLGGKFPLQPEVAVFVRVAHAEVLSDYHDVVRQRRALLGAGGARRQLAVPHEAVEEVLHGREVALLLGAVRLVQTQDGVDVGANVRHAAVRRRVARLRHHVEVHRRRVLNATS